MEHDLSESRPPIPIKLRREVLIEAGHRCSIPTCKQVPIDIHHIIPYEKCQEHVFDNLIALCCGCHARYHRYGDIDLKSLQLYKINLGLLNHRYGEIERRILQYFCDNSHVNKIQLPGLHEIHVLHLLKDGLIVKTGQCGGIVDCGIPSWEEYQLTDKGKQFVNDWKNAHVLN